LLVISPYQDVHYFLSQCCPNVLNREQKNYKKYKRKNPSSLLPIFNLLERNSTCKTRRNKRNTHFLQNSFKGLYQQMLETGEKHKEWKVEEGKGRGQGPKERRWMYTVGKITKSNWQLKSDFRDGITDVIHSFKELLHAIKNNAIILLFSKAARNEVLAYIRSSLQALFNFFRLLFLLA
jgi:hypothetical protein